jgi:hypothetical protein
MNFVALFLSSLVGTGIGLLWYSHYLFGDKHSSAKPEEKTKYIFVFVTTCIVSIVIGQMIILYRIDPTFFDGVLFGGIVGLGLITPSIATNYVLDQKPLNKLLIVVGHHIAVCITIGAIHALFS